MHVVDTPFLDKIDALGVGEIHEIKENLKNKAENAFKTIIDNENSTGLTIDTMVVEGVPFLEILKISKDLDVSMILLGKRSDRKDVSQFFFGSVAEKVIRLSPIPVIVIP